MGGDQWRRYTGGGALLHADGEGAIGDPLWVDALRAAVRHDAGGCHARRVVQLWHQRERRHFQSHRAGA